MTRGPERTPRPAPKRPARDPYGILPTGTPIAAALSIAGLVVIALVTIAIGSGQLPVSFGSVSGPGPAASGDNGVVRTPTPSNEVVVPSEPPGIQVPGTFVYAKAGNIWVQSNGQATQITSNGNDSMPSFSKDGSSVYFVRTRPANGAWPFDGVMRDFQMDVPSLMQVPVAGGQATRLIDGLIDPPGKQKWMGFIREPVISPDGSTVAMVSDLPDPTHSDVTLKLYNLRNGTWRNPGLDEVPPLGHQDPAWRPDGKAVAYVRADRDGAKGTPRIYLYTPATNKAKAITGPGYLEPSWSPDGKYIAATRTTAIGTDIAILNAANGTEVLRVTNDGDSWAPVWSPAGDQLAYLHVAGQVVDLRLAQLDGSAPAWSVKDTTDLTSSAGLDGVSRPGWFVPPGDMPAHDAGACRFAFGIVTRAPYLERVAARTAAAGTVLCLGIDPEPSSLPTGFPATVDGVERFSRLLLEAALPHAAAVKPNLAFFEALGSPGIAVLERLRALVPPEIPFIADAKRGDIGTTAARQATALFDVLDADAVTVNPYLGEEAIAPLLARADRFAYILCRTSNPGAGEVQGLEVAADELEGHPAEPLWARVARRVRGWGPGGNVGLVVGATAPGELAVVRAIAPELPFLVPGVGAQGGDIEPVLAAGPATAPPAGLRRGGGLLVNVSRGIARAALGDPPPGASADAGERIVQAAAEWAVTLAVLP